jgi:hypothetical protein
MWLDWVKRLSDRKGDYELFIKCEKCGHYRHARPEVFARLIGRDGLLATLRERLRCSQCGGREPLINVLSGRYAKRD